MRWIFVDEEKLNASELLGKIERLFYDDYEVIRSCVDKDYSVDSDSIESFFFDKVIIADKNVDKVGNKRLYDETYAKKGVYVFKITKDVKFKDSIYLQKAAQPKDLKLREYKIGDILYVGKSLELGPRIREHHKEIPSDTSSLVLGSEKRKFLKGHYKIYMFSLKKEFKSTDSKPYFFEKLILSGIEALMHDKMKPKIGSSKT
jgi:hypothetical protein